jgi:ankyrin repeat protein
VVYICGLVPARIRRALAELPETLDETYERALREIKKAEWEITHRLFQFVAVACRPLRVEELAELLAFDFEAGPIPKFYEDWRLEDPVDAVLSTSSLLAIVDGGDSFGKVIQFSHISVKEFLTSARLAIKGDIITRRYHISMTRAHTLAAQACLSILLHLDKDVITSESLQEYPLAEYAAEHWADHARFEDVSRNVEDGMKLLFHPSRPHLAVSIWIHDPELPTRRRTERARKPLSLTGTPLHYAALWGLHTIVEFLVIEHSQAVHCRGLTNMVTPLHLASKEGHVDIARFLIEHGADAGARDNDNCTPLHWASQQGHSEVVRVLVERGVEVNARDHSDWTPLHAASQNGRLEVVRFLLEHGADADASDRGGWTPLQWPSCNGDLEIVRVLLEHGVDANTQDNSDWTPLHGASQRGHPEVIRILLDHGMAAVDPRNNSDWTPLHSASQQGHTEVVRVLIENGANPNFCDNSNQTPLHLASRAGHLLLVQVLIVFGVEFHMRNNEGRTPREEAVMKGHHDVMESLLEYESREDGV